jgi:hypothetical protein
LLHTRAALIAENLFLRKQLAMFQERKARPRRAKSGERLALLALARFFNWRETLVIVKPETFTGWHRAAFRAFWRWKSLEAWPATMTEEPARTGPGDGRSESNLGRGADC